MLELERFAQDLHQEVLVKCANDASPQMREDAFTECVLERLAEHNEADGIDLCYHYSESRGRWPAAKLNAWGMSGDDATLDLFVTLYHGTGEVESIGLPETRRYFALLRNFLRLAREGLHKQLEESSDVFVVAQRINEAGSTLTTVRLFFLSDGVARAEDIEQEQIEGIDVRYVLWDLRKLSQLHVGHREVIELDFLNDYGGAIQCLEFADPTQEYRTFLAFFPAIMLARIYGEHGQRLLERNVRAFLQVKGKVNKGLQQTLRDEPHRFLAYNNGLCCTAAEIRVENAGNGHCALAWLRDFQIVNGGQTTASIFHALRKEKLDLSHVTVQVKLTVLNDPARVVEIVPMISRYANSQNKVNGADFSANGKFHRDLEELSRTVWAPAASGLERGSHWYYERARGSYLDDKSRQGTDVRKKEWANQNPPPQKFTKTDLAKHEHAWLALPHLICKGAEKNFDGFAKRLEDDGEPVVDLQFFQHVIARAILWRSTEKLFDALNLAGYRANTVAYSVAWLAEHSGRRLDLDRIWREQALPSEISEALRIICQEAYRYLTSQGGNVGEVSKKPETWATFRDMQIKVGDRWRKELVQDAVVVYPTRKPSAEAQSARVEVSQVSAERWFALSKWAKERGFLEGWERGLAFSLGKLAARKGEPSDKQVVQGARIISRANELGFVMQDATTAND